MERPKGASQGMLALCPSPHKGLSNNGGILGPPSPQQGLGLK